MVPVLIGMVLVCGRAPADPARDRVAIAIAADSANVERVSQVLKELLGRLGVASEIRAVTKVDPVAVVTPPPEPEQALARVFIDASGDDGAIVYIVDTRQVVSGPPPTTVTFDKRQASDISAHCTG